MNKTFLPAKLLFVSVNKGLGKYIITAAKRGGATRVTRLFDQITEENDSVDRGNQGLRRPHQDAAMILLRDEAQSVIDAIVEETAQKKQYRDGMAVVIDVTKVLRRSDTISNSTEEPSHISKGEKMKSGFTMITSITNHGHAEELMAVAREAGAKSGTILDARGTCSEDEIKFLGISLAPEKEVLIIVSEEAKTQAILTALKNQVIFKETGGGIIFTVDIDQYVALGACC